MQTKSDDSLHIKELKTFHCCLIYFQRFEKIMFGKLITSNKTVGVGVTVLLIYFDSH